MLKFGSTVAEIALTHAICVTSVTEDQIRGQLLNSDAPGRQEILDVLLPRLYQLNRDRFSASPEIGAIHAGSTRRGGAYGRCSGSLDGFSGTGRASRPQFRNLGHLSLGLGLPRKVVCSRLTGGRLC